MKKHNKFPNNYPQGQPSIRMAHDAAMSDEDFGEHMAAQLKKAAAIKTEGQNGSGAYSDGYKVTNLSKGI